MSLETTRERKREGRRERGEEKRTAGTHNFYIAYFGDSSERQKSAATHRSDTSTERYRFQNPGIYWHEMG